MRDLDHRRIPDSHVNIGIVGSGLPIRVSLGRRAGHLIVAAIVLVWAAMATPMLPLMAAQCSHAKQKPVCHDTQTSPENKHACCHETAKSEPTPPPSPTPGCPMHEGMPASSCMNVSLSCCAMEERESVTRRTVKPEKKNNDEQIAAQVVAANASHSLSSQPGPERQTRSGLRYEKPVLELKTDLRV
jgi:hypothetical protein